MPLEGEKENDEYKGRRGTRNVEFEVTIGAQ